MYKKPEADKAISSVLKISSGFSLILMASGLALFLSGGRQVDLTRDLRITGLTETLAGIFQLDPVALMTMGIIILISTPLVRVAGVFFSFWFIEKDKVYALISLGVLMILGASLFVPGIK